MKKLEKQHLKFILAPLFLLALILLILLPYFTKNFSNIRQEKEDKASLARKVQEEKVLEKKAYLTGKFDPSLNTDFVLIPSQYTTNGLSNMYLRKETLQAFIQMHDRAQEAGITIRVASATRNFDSQKNLWNKQWRAGININGESLGKNSKNDFIRFKKILEYIAVPGTSRHHWGTDIDINGANVPYFNSEQGIREYQWLVKNAGVFGFCQTYRDHALDRRTGYREERWHWSYLPLARTFTEEYRNLIKNEDIKGFLGDEYALDQEVVTQYALSINPACL